jgi:hypothetical protein
VKFFRRKKKESLSELQGVPDGTFRCDVCKFVQPLVCLCGAVLDSPIEIIHRTESAVRDNQPQNYTLCGVCAMWLGFGEFRFPQGVCFMFSDEQREKIRALHKELDIADKELMKTASLSVVVANTDRDKSLEILHEYLERVPNLREVERLRFSLLPENIVDLSGKLTRGEFVDPSEIEKANK